MTGPAAAGSPRRSTRNRPISPITATLDQELEAQLRRRASRPFESAPGQLSIFRCVHVSNDYLEKEKYHTIQTATQTHTHNLHDPLILIGHPLISDRSAPSHPRMPPKIRHHTSSSAHRHTAVEEAQPLDFPSHRATLAAPRPCRRERKSSCGASYCCCCFGGQRAKAPLRARSLNTARIAASAAEYGSSSTISSHSRRKRAR